MFDNEGHWIDDPPEVVSTKPDFSGLGLVRHLTDKEKLKKMHELGQAMYDAALILTTDASRLRKAMEDWKQFTFKNYYDS